MSNEESVRQSSHNCGGVRLPSFRTKRGRSDAVSYVQPSGEPSRKRSRYTTDAAARADVRRNFDDMGCKGHRQQTFSPAAPAGFDLTLSYSSSSEERKETKVSQHTSNSFARWIEGEDHRQPDCITSSEDRNNNEPPGLSFSPSFEQILERDKQAEYVTAHSHCREEMTAPVALHSTKQAIKTKIIPTKLKLSPVQSPAVDVQSLPRVPLDTWSQRLEELQQFKRRYGSCKVPQKWGENPKLGVWVNKQRCEYKLLQDGKKSSMTAERIRSLENIGFVWARRKGQPIWDERFRQLSEYRSRHGDCLVPTKYSENPALGRWVSTQRLQYRLHQEKKKTSLTPQRIAALDGLQFVWKMQCRKNP